MIELETTITVPGLQAAEVLDFLVNCTDERYQAWWPGVHLQFHTVRRVPGDVGSLVYMDEFIGRHRLRMHAVVTELTPARLICRMKKGILLPAWLILEFTEGEAGLHIRHAVRAGLPGLGRLLDPLLCLFLTPGFAKDLDQHVRTEFPRLAALLALGSPRRPSNRYPLPSKSENRNTCPDRAPLRA